MKIRTMWEPAAPRRTDVSTVCYSVSLHSLTIGHPAATMKLRSGQKVQAKIRL
jgi:hypothetical protein